MEKNIRKDNEAAGLLSLLIVLVVIGVFLTALVAMAILTIVYSAVLGILLLIGMLVLWFGPAGWKPFIMMAIIAVLAVALVLVSM